MRKNVSIKYPVHDLIPVSLSEIGIDFEFTDNVQHNVKEFHYCIKADCWGIYIQRKSGAIEPRVNIYALWDAIGRSFGKKRRKNAQYDYEDNYQSRVRENVQILLDELEIGDKAVILMFGEPHVWSIECTKRGDEDYTFKTFAHPILLKNTDSYAGILTTCFKAYKSYN